ncbi:hypothetical protein XENOCAPTIV_006096, partial [Xenoophorus captivus]
MVGKRLMTPNLAQHYEYMENGTHFSFVVPFSSPDVSCVYDINTSHALKHSMTLIFSLETMMLMKRLCSCPNPVDPYQVVYHPVWPDVRVGYPSHFKRFEVQMFAFAEDKDNLSTKLFVHCDVVICDTKNPLGGVCGGQCSNPKNSIK